MVKEKLPVSFLRFAAWLFKKSIGDIPEEKRKEIYKGIEALAWQAAKAYIEYQLNKQVQNNIGDR